MKVKKLIKLLLKENPEALVVMSKDAEGNNFSPLELLQSCGYSADSTWSGEIDDNGEPAVCLWPVN